MRTCSDCGLEFSGRASNLCQRCYQYYRRHPEGKYPIPEDGVITYADNGDIVCHECGKAYPKLIQHVYYTHHMSHNEYCDKHKFLHNTKFTAVDYQDKMRTYSALYADKVIKDNLLIKGQSTRFIPGQDVPGRGHHIKKGGDLNENES